MDEWKPYRDGASTRAYPHGIHAVVFPVRGGFAWGVAMWVGSWLSDAPAASEAGARERAEAEAERRVRWVA
jgi:hypothetical protein